MICDRDEAPPLHIPTPSSSPRLRVLQRYHLENYFLDENVLARVFETLEPEGSWLRSPAAIRKCLRELAQKRIPYATALATSSYIRAEAGNVDIMAKGCDQLNIDQLVEQILGRAAIERVRVSESLRNDAIEHYARRVARTIQDSLDQDTDEWKHHTPGKALFNMFADRVKLDAARLKTAYIICAQNQSESPFQEIIDIFASFSST